MIIPSWAGLDLAGSLSQVPVAGIQDCLAVVDVEWEPVLTIDIRFVSETEGKLKDMLCKAKEM